MKRLRKILKWTAIALGVSIAILLVANAWFVWTTDTRLEGQLAAIRAAGEPLSLAELAREPLPPENNAATYLRRAQADIEAIDKELTKLGKYSQYPVRSIPAEQQEAIQAALDAYPRAIPLLEQAAACPDYDPQLDYTLPFHEFMANSGEHLRKDLLPLARVLRLRAELAIAHATRDEAVRTALMNFRLARHFDRNPLLIGYLMAGLFRTIAIEAAKEALQSGPVSKELHDALDPELALQQRMEAYAWAIQSDRAMGLDFFRTIPWRNFWVISRGRWNQRESEYLAAVQAFLTLVADQRPYRDAEKTIAEMKFSDWSLPGTASSQDFRESANSVHERITRTRAMIRCLRVLNALQIRTPADDNEVPQLGQLGLPAEATTDPYTGEPLHVKKTPHGWLVYSVGRNFQDDGGKIDGKIDDERTDVGVGPPPAAAKPAKR